MSQDLVLYTLLKSTFDLLLENEDIGENCEFLVQKLDVRIQQLHRYGISNELFNSLSKLKDASVSIRDCFKILKGTTEAKFAGNSNNESELRNEIGSSSSDISNPETGSTSTNTSTNTSTGIEHPFRDKTEKPNDPKDNKRLSYNSKDAELQKELQQIKESDKFKKAVNYFQEVNDSSGKVFKSNVKRGTKITATKVRVVSEILGNLTNLAGAAENCKQYISQLHESFNAQEDVVGLHSVMHINVVVFRFVKEFITKPVAMLDWPMIDAQGPEKYHPILEVLPNPLTHITDINKDKVEIDSCISAINCSGDIFAKETTSTDIVRITPSCNKWYSFDDPEKEIVSISIDCGDCETSTEPQSGETSTRSSMASSSLVCNGKMYILARGKSRENLFRYCYFLYVVDMKGNKEHEEELGFLERSATEVPKVKIFCIKDKKVIILDVTRRIVHICDNKGMEKNTIDVTAYLSSTNHSRPPIFTYNAEMICLALESKFNFRLNFRSKLNVYNIVIDEEGSSLEKTSEITVKRAVQAVAFNQRLGEIIVLCYTMSLQYHLVIYTKDGELVQDITINNGTKYWSAGLISNPNGPVALLDNSMLLHLK